MRPGVGTPQRGAPRGAAVDGCICGLADVFGLDQSRALLAPRKQAWQAAKRRWLGNIVGKNILIFSDGTGQAGGYMPDEARSNVYKLFRATRVSPDTAIDPKGQIAFYDGGLGSRASGEQIKIEGWRRIYNLLGKATGLGITQNIIDCYAAIVRVWEPGDRIYLFGFSRGAYTVRCVGGVLKYCGVPTAVRSQRGRTLPLERDRASVRRIAAEAVKHVYQYGSSIKGDPYRQERERRAVRFRWKYCAGDQQVSNTAPYFIGVWDTIGTLGAGTLGLAIIVLAHAAASALFAYLPMRLSGLSFWAIFLTLAILLPVAIYLIGCLRYKGLVSLARYRMAFYDTKLHYAVRYARHALSIDENRESFACIPWDDGGEGDPRLARGNEVPRFQQVWFAGNHSDIGGSYPENESRLSDIALAWMVQEIMSLPQPVRIDHSLLKMHPDCAGVQHDEREAFLSDCPRWLKRSAQWLVGSRNFGWREGRRRISLGAQLHPSVRERFELSCVLMHGKMRPYRPEALRHHPAVSEFWSEPSAANRQPTPAPL
jgi:uncharacterized protein (DUF2235 family)